LVFLSWRYGFFKLSRQAIYLQRNAVKSLLNVYTSSATLTLHLKIAWRFRFPRKNNFLGLCVKCPIFFHVFNLCLRRKSGEKRNKRVITWLFWIKLEERETLFLVPILFMVHIYICIYIYIYKHPKIPYFLLISFWA